LSAQTRGGPTWGCAGTVEPDLAGPLEEVPSERSLALAHEAALGLPEGVRGPGPCCDRGARVGGLEVPPGMQGRVMSADAIPLGSLPHPPAPWPPPGNSWRKRVFQRRGDLSALPRRLRRAPATRRCHQLSRGGPRRCCGGVKGPGGLYLKPQPLTVAAPVSPGAGPSRASCLPGTLPRQMRCRLPARSRPRCPWRARGAELSRMVGHTFAGWQRGPGAPGAARGALPPEAKGGSGAARSGAGGQFPQTSLLGCTGQGLEVGGWRGPV